MKKGKKIIFISVGFVISSLIVLSSIAIHSNFFAKSKLKENSNNDNESKYITVRIDGAVLYPGDYSLKFGATINDLLIKSKLKFGANLNNVNRQEKLKDNQKIFIKEFRNVKKELKYFKNASDFINLGIRKKIAVLIISHLEENDYKTTWQELAKINGIGEKTLKILQNNILL
ncbi:hypothetical protein DA803_01110 [[Mycoplasma] phocae]|uniref:Soluble ligand binding domain-containing protein n=1 Tax=[Mycoplasma] phocae TaxID=142651 RepID=A0A2Z5IPQ3_9BACT|nr:hypothetical protein [[Mycoplasma] phocae]AXE60689.1 hypothetical protein DA803_01110 [[Mycoplasma] phocae]